MSSILFIIIFSLLFIHEMDAIRTKEWRMFLVLKDMREEAAYKVFAILHLPLYAIALYIMVQGSVNAIFTFEAIIAVFLIAHGVVHWGFRKHKHNNFKSQFSKIMICSMAVLSVLFLGLLLFEKVL